MSVMPKPDRGLPHEVGYRPKYPESQGDSNESGFLQVAQKGLNPPSVNVILLSAQLRRTCVLSARQVLEGWAKATHQ